MELEYWLLYLGVIGIVTLPVVALYAILSLIARIFYGMDKE